MPDDPVLTEEEHFEVEYAAAHADHTGMVRIVRRLVSRVAALTKVAEAAEKLQPPEGESMSFDALVAQLNIVAAALRAAGFGKDGGKT